MRTMAVRTSPPSPSEHILLPHDLRILIVDDNIESADILGLLIEANGYLSKVAYSAFNGLNLKAEFEPDIIFCNLGMPGM